MVSPFLLHRRGASRPFLNRFSIEMDGVGDYVNFGAIASFERTQAFSLVNWFNTSDAGSNVFWAKRSPSAERGWLFFIFAGDIYFMLDSDGSAGNRLFINTTGTDFADGAWHLAILTYDGSSNASGVHIYVDDNDESLAPPITDGLSATIITPVTCQLGAQDATDNMNGFHDESAIYTKKLSAGEASEIYGPEGKPVDLRKLSTASDLYVWPQFTQSDKDNFPAIADHSGNARNGTAIDMVASRIQGNVPT